MESTNSKTNMNILSYIITIVKYKKMIIISVLLMSIFAVTYIMLVPKSWTSTTTIKPISNSSMSLPFSAGSLLNLGSSMMSGSQLTAHEFISIMKSRTFSEEIIEKFNLYEYFELEYDDENINREKAVRALRDGIVNIDLNDLTGMISISIETKDKLLSVDLANYYTTKLNEYNINDRTSKAKQSRVFLEERVLEITNQITNLGGRLKEIQKTYNIIELESQAKMLIDNYSLMISKLEEEKITYEFMKIMYINNENMLDNQMAKIEILQKRIDEIETDSANNPLYQLKFTDIPEISFLYGQLEMQLEINKKVLEFVYPQLEASKIEELKKSPSIEVIDLAVPAGMRTKPRRAFFCVSIFMLSLIFFTALAFVIEAVKISLLDKNNQMLVNEIKSNLYAKK